jgi:hypothetical protein
MSAQESLSLFDRFKLSHPSLSHPGSFIPDKAGQALGLLYAIILILFSAVYRLGDEFPMSNTVTAQLISHDLPGLPSMTSQ